MSVKLNLHRTIYSRSKGFTLIELVVVLAGLGILSSLAIPNYLKYLDYAKVDQAKSILNSAAADCLQGLRNDGDARLGQVVDRTLLSTEILESIEYDFKSNLNTCGSVLISTTSPNANKRLPTLGFNISSSGKVTKQSVDEGGDTTAPAKSWAGVNMTEGEGLQEFLEYKALIAAAQVECQANLETWLKTNGNGKYDPGDWNSNATSKCPTNPPKKKDGGLESIKTEYCTPKGCNGNYYALDGKKVGTTPESYEKALADKYGAGCTAWAKKKRDSSYTNPSSASETKEPDCAGRPFWFYQGTDAGSQKAWEILNYKANNPTGKQTLSDGSELYLCLGEEKATEALMTKCINDNEEAGCENEINKKLAEKYNGEFVAKTGGPGVCSSVNWMCEGKNYQTDKSAYDDSCAKKDCGEPVPMPKKCDKDPSKLKCKDWLAYVSCISG